jgi:hypothetical protein
MKGGEKEMKKVLSIVVAIALLGTLSGLAVASSGHPSAKTTAECSRTTLIGQTGAADTGWIPVLWNTIKTPNQKDLFIDVSLVSGLYTQTHVKSKRNSADDEDWDTSKAKAQIDVRVVIDPGLTLKELRTQRRLHSTPGSRPCRRSSWVYSPVNA